LAAWHSRQPGSLAPDDDTDGSLTTDDSATAFGKKSKADAVRQFAI